MKNLFFRSLLLCSVVGSLIKCSAEDDLELEDQLTEEAVSEQKRMIRLNNYPISIFTPQTQQFTPGSNIAVTGATGTAAPCLSSLAMLRRTQLNFSGMDIFSGQTGTFDTGVFSNFVSNPVGSPSSLIPSQSLTAQVGGYYLVEVSFAGDQITTDRTVADFYANFNLLINGVVSQQFALATFGIRQIWQQIIWLNESDVISLQAGSDISFFVPAFSGIAPVDALIWTLNRVGPCQVPG